VNDKKHVIVGLFVLVGLVLLGLMVVWFEGVAWLMRGGYQVSARIDTALGVREGKRVTMDGIEIGEVRQIATARPEAEGVWIRMYINKSTAIPAHFILVAQRGLTGDVLLDFEPDPDVAPPKTITYLARDGKAVVEGRIETFLPKDVITKFGKMMDNLEQLTEPRTLEEVKAGKPMNLASALAQFQLTAATLQTEIEDPKSEFNLLLATARTSAADLSKTLGEVDNTLAKVQTIAQTYEKAGVALTKTSADVSTAIERVAKDAEDLRILITNINTLVENFQKGKGTLGKLVTSDELHRELVNLIENIQKMTDNANRLFILWREEGVFSKEGK
jgi:phospholipid/cholesterol/gamma-HCH transport system substrate-binding protein